MHQIIRFLKNWTLPVAMTVGIAAYFIAVRVPFLKNHGQEVMATISVVQPVLIFLMLFITFCKINLSQLRLRSWHLGLLLFQALTFVIAAAILLCHTGEATRVAVEGTMLCLICPTATAGAVVTARLGGDAAGLTTYTILINILVAVLVPLVGPLIHPHPELGFVSSFFLIMGKVFPMLICPLFAAVLLRALAPKVVERLTAQKNLAFYLWAVALALALAVTARSLVHSEVAVSEILWIGVGSLLACVAQFAFGRYWGKKHGEPIAAAQSLGQKNTVFAIWMGYTFFTPVTAVAGGFYSIWHNVFNSWQLYKAEQRGEGGAKKVSAGHKPAPTE